MLKIFAIINFLFPMTLFAEDIALTVEDFDIVRNRTSLLVLDSSQVPLGTSLRVHGKTGTCVITITEKVNDHLVASTEGCDQGTIRPGMKLAYTTQNNWEAPKREVAAESVETRYNAPDIFSEILARTTVYIGHNFSGELEGNVRSDGSIKNLDGDTAFSFGLKGRLYDFTPRLSFATEIGYETPRTLDQATFTNTNNQETIAGTMGYSPRLSLWSIAFLGEARVMDRLNGFAGINISIPSLRNSPFSIRSDLGFQGGANYQLYPQIAIEGLIKVSNMNLKNDIGETTDVSLAGLEIRGRYSF